MDKKLDINGRIDTIEIMIEKPDREKFENLKAEEEALESGKKNFDGIRDSA